MTAPAMDRAAIEAAIPHRDPFLLVDRVIAIDAERATAEWDVPADAAWFRGHYPGEPVLPGVLLCEHAFQCAALVLARRLGGFGDGDGIPVLSRIVDARFRRLVRPGETLATEVAVTTDLGAAFELSATTTCGGRRAARLAFVLAATGALARAAGETREDRA